MGIQQYHSNLIATEYYLYSDSPIKGKGWVISLEDDPSCDRVVKTHFEGHTYPAKEIVIHASSEERAQYVADMVYASYCLNHAELLPFFGRTRVFPVSTTPLQDTSEQDREVTGTKASTDLSQACMIAAKASYRKTYQYALFKYLLSHQLLPTSIMDLDPSHWWPGPFVSFSAEHHVHCAYAIVAAYSVLEELGLELRASDENPSTINGEWNPAVRNKLEDRLLKAGIDLSETILWHMRDTPTRIERARPLRTQSKAEWAYGKIRDAEVEVVDAIAHANWLRSKVSAHKLRELSESLSYYDVSNMQHLARRLLLEVLGFWRYQP